MASLKLSDSAFGSVGLVIAPDLDLQSISDDLNALLGVPIFLNNLDVSGVTLTGLTAAGRISEGIPVAGSTLTVGGFANFEFGPNPSIAFFNTLAFTQQTILADGGEFFSIGEGDILSAVENSLRFDEWVNTFDFSATGSAFLEIFVDSVAPFDSPDNAPYSGYRIVGNDGFNIINGKFFDENLQYQGGNTYVMGAGTNVFFGFADNALVEGGTERDELFGGEGADTLLGGEGNDILFGGDNDDIVNGGAGNDLIYGSLGDDSLTGGAGMDRFVFANNYDIVTSVSGEGGFITVNTGFNVSNGVDGVNINVLEDFTSGEDLVVFPVQVDPQGQGSNGYRLLPETGPDGENRLTFQILDGMFEPLEQFVIEDVSASLDTGGVLVRLEQVVELVSFQDLDLFFSPDENDAGLVGAVSMEIAFTNEAQSSADNIKFFFGLSTLRETGSGFLGGQDKFDLTAFGLTEFRLDPDGSDSRLVLDGQGGSIEVTGVEEAVKGILFSFVDPQQSESFLYDQLSQSGGSQPDFFYDLDAGVYRPVHVEYMLGQGDDIFVYVDTDRNGAYDYETDLAFRVSNVFSDSPGDLAAANLYSDSLGDGSGTGIFIFNEDQYALWFNDGEFGP